MTPTLGPQVHKDMVNAFELAHVEDSKQVVMESESFSLNSSEDFLVGSKWMKLGENEICEMLIMRDQEYWRSLDEQEVVELRWLGKDKGAQAPTVRSLTNNFNQMVNWAISAVLLCGEVKNRRDAIHSLVEIAHRAKSMLAFNVFVAIFSALNSTSVQRLKQSWEGISNMYKSKWAELEKLMSPNSNHSALREAIKQARTVVNVSKMAEKVNPTFRRFKVMKEIISEDSSMDSQIESPESSDSGEVSNPKRDNEKTPYTPFFGLMLRDMVSIEESGGYVTGGGLVNFKKLSMMRKIVEQILEVKERPFDLHSELSLSHSLLNSSSLIEEGQLISVSKKLED